MLACVVSALENFVGSICEAGLVTCVFDEVLKGVCCVFRME